MQITMERKTDNEGKPEFVYQPCCKRMDYAVNGNAEEKGAQLKSEYLYVSDAEPYRLFIEVAEWHGWKEYFDFCPFCGEQIDIIDITNAES